MTTISSFILGLMLLQCLVAYTFAAVVFRKRELSVTNKYLGLLLIAAANSTLLQVIPYTSGWTYNDYPWLLFLTLPVDALMMPAGYLYITGILDGLFPKKRVPIYFHLTASVVCLALLTPIFLSPLEYQQQFAKLLIEPKYFTEWSSQYNFSGLFLSIASIAFISTGITYLTLGLIEFVHYRQYIKSLFSDIESLRLNWIVGLLLIFLCYTGGSAYFMLQPIFGNPYFIDAKYIFNFILFVCFFVYVLYQTTSYPFLFDAPDLQESKKYLDSKSRTKLPEYTQDELNELEHKINTIIAEEKVHLKRDLTISELATHLDLKTTARLSELLKNIYGQSFYDFINNHRISNAKELLITRPEMPILDVAFESGFNSTSVFYDRFKKLTDITPAQYRKNNR